MNPLEDFFDTRSVDRGHTLFLSKAVKRVTFNQAHGSLQSSVQGTLSRPYSVRVLLDNAGDPTDAMCSCPVGHYCKHAVATIFAHRAQLESNASPSRNQWDAPGGTPEPDFEQRAQTIETQEWWDQWLAIEPRSTRSSPSAQHTDKSHARIYSLQPQDVGGPIGIGATVTLFNAPRTLAGHFAPGKRVKQYDLYDDYRVHLTTSDKEIHALGSARLQASRGRYSYDEGKYELTGHFGQLMLELVVKSDRCFMGKDRHTPVTIASPKHLAIDWMSNTENQQRLTVKLDGLTHWVLIPTENPWWIDLSSAKVGPIETELTGEQIALLIQAPNMTDSHLQAVVDWQDELPEESSALSLLPPPPVSVSPLIEATPTPLLYIHSANDNPHVSHWEIEFLMRYGDVVVTSQLSDGTHVQRVTNNEGHSVRLIRLFDTEENYFVQLMTMAPMLEPQFKNDTHGVSITLKAVGDTPVSQFAAYRQLVSQSKEIENLGWEIIVVPPVQTEALSPGNFDGLIEPIEDGRPGWFDLSLGFEMNGERYDLVPLVASYLEQHGCDENDESLFVETDDGRFIEIQASLLRPVANVLKELGESSSKQQTIRLSRARALSLEALESELNEQGIDTHWKGSRSPFEFAKQLRELATVDANDFAKAPLPRGLKATLRPYQRIGLGWLNTLAKNDLCGVLADDMGLGKTLQTLAHILWLRQSRRLKGPVLIIAPTSLLLNWAREAARFTPRLNTRIWHGMDRHQVPLNDPNTNAHLIITSYGLALRDRDLLAEHGFDMLVLDEAQHIRNAQTKTTRAIKSLPIERRLCLSGTPLENHLGELWSLFDFLMPDLLGDAQRFNSHYRNPIERHGNTDKQKRLATAVSPFLLRRRKEDVATDLPPKTEILREVNFNSAQEKLYESIRVSMQKRVRDALTSKGLAQSRVTVLDALLKLRQCCCHPELVKLDSARKVNESAKTTLVLDMIDELISEGRRILVFSSFTSMLSLLERELKARNHRWVKLTGQTRKRDVAIDAFQNGEVPLFLISLKAGGTGLNLTAADTVIHYDPWWNPAAEAQASARAHRIGQDKPVFVYKLIAANTVEQRIVTMQQRKQKLADVMLEGGDAATLSSLSVEETLALFD